MKRRPRKPALVLVFTNVASVLVTSLLVGGLGGRWLEVLALGLLLCITAGASYVVLWSWNVSMAPPPPRPRPTRLWREREGRRDGYVSDGDGPEVCITHPDGGPEFVEYVVGGFDGDERRTS